ncbi:hypothetical protein AMATHDRAFT_1075 [Amanita thiersii Skay4041]|uniref:PH domain-containing protein n=1 Tax=Amanita thiersii Skay4041 TaxID=703135 RepID=A0A2A9P0B2_9AGAR|nr:hypothetical protein AMATHDRAFT_1075 [Amanita thiersii Skay4041]
MLTDRKSPQPLRDRLLSNSPDPIKSSILRESGMGWTPPQSDPKNSASDTGSITSPLRITKRESPRSSGAQLARRTSSSYRHVRNNQLVSKSPFKSQIPTPLRPSSVVFPVTRRVSGEKRPRPLSIHEQTENENERPFALKRERRQSRGFQGLIEKEPVSKSPFRLQQQVNSNQIPVPPLPVAPPTSQLAIPSSSQATPESGNSISTHTPSSSTGPSPARSSLVSRRLHGPRLSGTSRRERRKTVTFDERCDVVEFDRDEDLDDDVFDTEDENETYDHNDPEQPEDDDPFFQGHRLQNQPSHPADVPDEGASFDSIHLPDTEADDTNPDLCLDPDSSITGLVDEMFASKLMTMETRFSTPPRTFDIPPELETEDGVPFGRSHHAERVLQHHQQQHQSPHPTPPPRFSPSQFSDQIQLNVSFPTSSSPNMHLYNVGLPTHSSPLALPATPPKRSPISVTSTPPLGRSTHIERIRRAKEEERLGEACDDDELGKLPGSPSPMKKHLPSPPDPSDQPSLLIPPLDITDAQVLETNRLKSQSGADPFAYSQRHDSFPSEHEDGLSGGVSRDESLNLSIGNSEISLSGLGRNPEASTVGSEKEDESFPEDEPFFDEAFRALSPRPIILEGSRSSPLNREHSHSPSPIPPRMSSPLFRATSPLSTGRNRSGSNSSSTSRQRITREDVHRRLLKRRSFGSPAPEIEPDTRRTCSVDSFCGMTIDMPLKNDPQDETGKEEELQGQSDHQGNPLKNSSPTSSPLVHSSVDPSQQASTHRAAQQVMEDKEFGLLYSGSPKDSSAHAQTEDSSRLSDPGKENRLNVPGEEVNMGSISSGSSGNSSATAVDAASGPNLKLDFADVDMDMKSALDRLMDDVAGVGSHEGEDSIMTDECNSYEPAVASSKANHHVPLQRAMTEPITLLHTSTGIGFSPDKDRSDTSTPTASTPPPPPPKDNIRAREQMILEKRREARRLEEEFEDESEHSREYFSPPRPAIRNKDKAHIQKQHQLLGVGRPSRRRSLSTGDADTLRGKSKDGPLNGVVGETEDALSDSIEKELKKLVDVSRKTKYQVREREATIYASSSDPDPDQVSHMSGPGDLNGGKAWRTVRRPSDMNEYSKQIKEYRAQEKPGKAYGKVFVKVLGLKNMNLPLPQQQTAFTCTLNNGIHFVTTPECQLGKSARIDQEFELIEHIKLEFTLTLKVQRDSHIITQFKALVPPPPAPPPIVQTSSKGGMRSFFSTPKKHPKEKTTIHPPPPVYRLPENLARYMKPDGMLARTFIAFKDIAPRCDTRIFETSYPLIGQRLEVGGKFSTQQVGELVLQIFRLPPLPGIAPDQLPQSLDECLRGLRHINWHKVTYFEGTLTQNGGDCNTWRRRQFRLIGANLVAFNDVTKKATATISLKKAIGIEDDQEARANSMSPGQCARYSDEILYGVERSFRLLFPEEEIIFFADTDEEKEKWLEIFRALVGHIPPHPLWGELLWQRQEELSKRNHSATPRPGISRS